MRFFPGAPPLSRARRPRTPDPSAPTRRHRLAVLVVGVLAVGSFAVPQAFADDEDDLRDEQKQVQGQISQAEDDLHEASKRVARTTKRLRLAENRLSTARARLVRLRADLKEARVQKRRLARQLARAQNRLKRVSAELEAAEADVADQKELLRQTVLSMETTGNPDLAVMDAVTSSGSIDELQVAETAGSMILGRSDQALDAYLAAEAALEDRKEDVEDARDLVARKEKAAARNLTRVETLFSDARTTKARVDRLVGKSRRARTAAVRAQDKDRAALKRLEAREARIKREILALTSNDDGPTHNGDTDGLLHTPVSGPVTSPFGWRTHPIYGYWGLHDGTDFGAGCGAALWAGESGTVINTYYDEVYGNRLYLSIGSVNGANLTLVYNHLSSYQVSEGAKVGRGDVVGYVGTTGWSTGCHLHFTVLRNGDPVDPMGYL